MFNIYQFEKQTNQDPKLVTKWTAKDKNNTSVNQVTRRKSETSGMRNKLVAGYKSRVTSFIKDMTVKPVEESDDYGKGFSQMSHAAKMLGPPRMNFGANRGDVDRVEAAIDRNSFIDSEPTEPERITWKMRPRNKAKEIGPSMRFNSHFQAERLMETLKNQTQTFFTREQVTGEGKQTQNLERNIREYNKTGKYGLSGQAFFPIDSNMQSSQPTSPNLGSMTQSPTMRETRQSKLQRSNYLLEPKSMMSSIHQKTHFKAAVSISRGDTCCVKVGANEFSDQFAEIARNIDAMNRSMHDFNSLAGAHRGPQVGDWLKRKRNCFSQGRQRRPGGQKANQQSGLSVGQTEQHFSDSVKDEGIFFSTGNMKSGQDPEGSHKQLAGLSKNSKAAPEIYDQDWNNMTDDEKQAFRMLSSQEINPESVTGQVLKLCNVVRQRLDVHGHGDFVRKRSGLGGTGGRRLSPELRMRFGTFGFNKRNQPQRIGLSKPSLQGVLDEKVLSSNTIPFVSTDRNEGSSQAETRTAAQTRGYERAGLRDSMDTLESQHAPPLVMTSVDMGMRPADSHRRSGSMGSMTDQRQKKKVVLKRPGHRTGSLVNPKLIKSLTNMTAKGSMEGLAETYN